MRNYCLNLHEIIMAETTNNPQTQVRIQLTTRQPDTALPPEKTGPILVDTSKSIKCILNELGADVMTRFTPLSTFNSSE